MKPNDNNSPKTAASPPALVDRIRDEAPQGFGGLRWPGRLGLVTAARIVAPLAAALVVAGVSAQQRPDFSGTWVVSAPSKSAGKEHVIKHDAASLSTTMGRRPVTYQLDGTEQASQVPMSGDVIRISTRAVWEKDRVVITERIAYPTGMKTVTRETWSLDARGRLIIDIVETMEGLPNKPDIQQIVLVRK